MKNKHNEQTAFLFYCLFILLSVMWFVLLIYIFVHITFIFYIYISFSLFVCDFQCIISSFICDYECNHMQLPFIIQFIAQAKVSQFNLN